MVIENTISSFSQSTSMPMAAVVPARKIKNEQNSVNLNESN